MHKFLTYLNSISIKTKIAGILIFFLWVFIALFISVSNVLTSTNENVEELSRLYTLKSHIFELNKDISETQRLVLAYGRTGSNAIYKKLGTKNSEVREGLETFSKDVLKKEISEIIQSLLAVSSRYDENIKSLKKLRERKEKLINLELPFSQSSLESEVDSAKISKDLKVLLEDYLYEMVIHSHNYFATKNYKSKKVFQKNLEAFKRRIPKRSPQLTKKLKNYQDTFEQTNIANRNYITLVNVVMSGEASEFSTLSSKLTDEVKILTENKRALINKKINRNYQQILLAFIVLLPFIFLAIFYSNSNITKSLVRISNTFDKFLNNDFSGEVPEQDRKDEIGRLANAAEEFKKLNKNLQEEKERAEKLAKTKADFLANMSHEIRTPMNGIMGMVEHLKDTKVNSDQKEMLETIDSCGLSLSTILNDILDLSKIESGKMALERSPISLKTLIKETEFLFKERAEKKGIYLKTNILGDNLPSHFLGDVTRIKQILINLLSNSIKFTKVGGIDLLVNGKVLEGDHLALTFSVKDTGIGIAEGKQDLIFQEFSQSDTSTTREYGGTGLGLSISKQLAEIMGSELKLKSTLNEGSEFFFTLNCEKAKISDTEQENQVQDKTLTFPRRRCLIVEDNQVNIKVLQKRLDKYKLSYDIALNGEEALQKEKEGHYHLIFMDLQMPVMDGLTATKLLRERGCKTPIVAMTANVQESDQKNCREAGMEYFVGKPVKKEQLEEVLTLIFMEEAS
jgi:signal transduction histidine kinase/CheY-like chemotaxis protein